MFKVIYILSGGHSGSTLLDLIIGSAPEVFSVGEGKFFGEYIEQGPVATPCTCGQSFRDCVFWSQFQSESKYSIRRWPQPVEGLKILWNIVNPFTSRFVQTEQEQNESFFQQIFKQASSLKPQLKYILDSSKDVFRLYRLAREMQGSLFVVHLIRDGRGYIHSYNNKLRAQQGHVLKSPLRSYLEWIAINVLNRILLNKLQVPHVTISYDLFCKNPGRYLSVLNHTLGINIPADFVSHVNQQVYHNIEGNRLRFKPLHSVRREESWRREFPWWKRLLTTFAVYPFNHFWVDHDSLSGSSKDSDSTPE